MNADQIKAAAVKLADLERIEQILASIKAGAAFTLQCGNAAAHLDKSRSDAVTRALETYLKGALATLKQDLGDVDGVEDPFDSALAKLDEEARPQ